MIPLAAFSENGNAPEFTRGMLTSREISCLLRTELPRIVFRQEALVG